MATDDIFLYWLKTTKVQKHLKNAVHKRSKVCIQTLKKDTQVWMQPKSNYLFMQYMGWVMSL